MQLQTSQQRTSDENPHSIKEISVLHFFLFIFFFKLLTVMKAKLSRLGCALMFAHKLAHKHGHEPEHERSRGE